MEESINFERKKNKDNFIKRFRNQLDIQSMVWPGLIFLLIFSYWPMYGIVMAFQKYDLDKGFMDSAWVGLQHFKVFLSDDKFYRVMRNTLGINMLGMIVGFPATIMFALFLNEIKNMKYKKAVQTISYLPHFISWPIYGAIVITLLSLDTGIINDILVKFNLIDKKIFFMGKPEYFWGIAIITSLLKGIGYNAIIYLAAIAGVSPELYEAATIDGAGRFKRMWYITLPCISATTVIMLIFTISYMLNSGFDQIWMLQNPLNLSMSETIDTYVYKVGIQQFRLSYSAAVGVFRSVLSLILLLSANFISRKLTDKSLF